LLTDDEEHDTDLSNGEETPDRGLFHQVVGDERGHEWTGQPKEDPLDDHVALHHKERSKHQKRVDGSTWRPVRNIVHWDTPGQMVFATESAKSLPTKPFSSSTRSSSWCKSSPIGIVRADESSGILGKEVTTKEHRSSKQTKPQNNVILAEELWVLGERAVDDVSEIRLVADVDEAEQGQGLVPEIAAIVYEEVLHALQELHQEEPEDTNGQTSVVGVVVNVN